MRLEGDLLGRLDLASIQLPKPVSVDAVHASNVRMTWADTVCSASYGHAGSAIGDMPGCHVRPSPSALEWPDVAM